jgi:serine/threonine protein kinase
MSNVYRIPRGDITLGKFLDKGGFAEVFEGTRRGGAPVAVKRLFDGLSEQSKVSFRREVDMMCQLRSDFIVSVHGLVDDPPHEPMLLVMERMHENLVRAYGSFPAPSLRQRVEWLVQAGRGISFLHSQSPPILHRDIKPANMLLTSPATGSRLKLSDLGLSKSLADITASLATRTAMPAAGGGSAAAAEVGTPHYKAPELMSLKPKYSPASDVYAFGVVCWETICMRLPYRGSSLQDIRAEVKAGNREDFELEDCPDFVFPPALKTMIERAWAQVDPPPPAPNIPTGLLLCFVFWRRIPRIGRSLSSACWSCSSSWRSWALKQQGTSRCLPPGPSHPAALLLLPTRPCSTPHALPPPLPPLPSPPLPPSSSTCSSIWLR